MLVGLTSVLFLLFGFALRGRGDQHQRPRVKNFVKDRSIIFHRDREAFQRFEIIPNPEFGGVLLLLVLFNRHLLLYRKVEKELKQFAAQEYR